MAIAVVHSAQGGSATSLTITSATAGNLLVAFIAQGTANSTNPTGSDNISGSTGWTTNPTVAKQSGNASTSMAYKWAVGGETTLAPTAGGSGVINGLSYFELSGCANPIVIASITGSAGGASQTSATTAAITTSNISDIILVAAGMGNVSGTINAWTASSGTAPTNVSTATSTVILGYLLPGAAVSGVTFSVSWTTSRTLAGSLAVALQPPTAAAIRSSNLMTMGMG